MGFEPPLLLFSDGAVEIARDHLPLMDGLGQSAAGILTAASLYHSGVLGPSATGGGAAGAPAKGPLHTSLGTCLVDLRDRSFVYFGGPIPGLAA